jgi:hypothetical protein
MDVRSEYANLLLLPWPLEVKASDFRPLDDSVRRPTKEPFAFFEFAPAAGLDFDLLDRVLVAAREEAGAVDVVMLPESAVEEDEIDELEALLQRHGVVFLQAGVRRASALPETPPSSASTRGSRKVRYGASRTRAGFTSASASITAGRSTRVRSTSTTSAELFIRASAGGKRWKSLAARSSSSKLPS